MLKTIVKLSAQWCGPCKVYANTFHRVKNSDEFKNLEFKEIDIENDEEGEIMVSKYGIRSVPTTLMLDENNEVVYKVMGNVPESELTKLINEALKK